MKKMLFRKLKKRKVQTIGIALLAFLWMFVSAFSLNLYITNLGFQSDYYEATKVEDFHFFPEDMNAVDDLAEEYSFVYEEEYAKDFEENGISYRVLSQTENIDVPYLVEGRLAEDENEILVNVEYAKEHDLQPGDELELQGNTYQISGIMTLVNYLRMHVRDDAFDYDPQNETLIVAKKDTVLQITDGAISLSYLARFKDSLSEEQKSELSSLLVRSNDFVSVTLQSDNSNITVLGGKISVYFLLTVISLCVMSIIIILLLLLFIYLMVNEDRKTIGILLANGMTRGKIWFAYFETIMCMLLPFGVVGFLAGSWSSPHLNKILEQDLSIPEVVFHISPVFFVVFMLVVTWVALLATLLGVNTILFKNIIDLLKNNKVKTVSRFEKVIKKVVRPRSVERKMKLSFAIRSKLLLILVLFSVFAAGVEFLLSYSIYRMPEKMKLVQSESMNFENQVYFDHLEDESTKEDQYFTQVSGVARSNEAEGVVQIYAIEEGDLLQIDVEHIEEGSVVLNQTSASILKVSVGDTLTLAIYDQEMEVTVQEICNRIVGKEIFVDYESLVASGMIEPGFTGMFTNKTKFDADEEGIASIVSREDILANYESSQEVMKAGSVILAVLGIVIPVILIAITVSVLISQNSKEIAILKANGITNQGMDKLIYGSYNVFLVLGIAISIPYSFMILQIIFSIAVKASGIKYPVEMDSIGILFAVGMTLCIYFGTMFILKFKNRTSVERITYDFG